MELAPFTLPGYAIHFPWNAAVFHLNLSSFITTLLNNTKLILFFFFFTTTTTTYTRNNNNDSYTDDERSRRRRKKEDEVKKVSSFSLEQTSELAEYTFNVYSKAVQVPMCLSVKMPFRSLFYRLTVWREGPGGARITSRRRKKKKESKVLIYYYIIIKYIQQQNNNDNN